MDKSPEISLVIPLYNEEESFAHLKERLLKLFETVSFSVECVLVDDGSKDNTRDLMTELSMQDERFVSLILSKNYGHQLALSAGLSHANGTKGIMVLDGDLQDPPELLSAWYKELDNGYDVIYGVRQMREDEGFFKRTTSKWFYRILNMLVEEELPLDSGDFCMISRRVVNLLNNMPEQYRFIRGMRASLGFKQLPYEYERQERIAGETKYSLKKMMGLAFDAIYGFSELPYKAMIFTGVSVIGVTFIYLILSLLKSMIFGNVVSGFLGILTAILLTAGINLIGLGILGGYIIRNFFQLKNRPLYLIDEKIHQNKIEKISY